MKHGTKELLRTIISNQELMMKALNIEPVRKDTGRADSKKKSEVKSPAKAAKPGLKRAVKKVVKKASKK